MDQSVRTHAHERACAPWCTEHHDGGRHPEDAACRSHTVSTAYGDLSLTHTLNEGTVAWLMATRDHLTIDQLKELNRALATLTATACPN